jgi:hypothetical protein
VKYLKEMQLLPAGTFKIGKDDSAVTNVNVFNTECKYGQAGNYFEMFILPNGTLFMSEPLLEEILAVGGVESLAFVLLNDIAHVIKKHSRANLKES